MPKLPASLNISSSDISEKYKSEMREELQKPYKYEEYVEQKPDKTKSNPSGIKKEKEYSDLDGIETKNKFRKNLEKTRRFSLGGIRRYSRDVINRLLGRKKVSSDEITAAPFESDLTQLPRTRKSDTDAKETTKTFKYSEYKPSAPVEFTKLPSAQAMMEHLNGTGSVELSIPNSGGLKPNIAELPPVEKDYDLNRTVKAGIRLQYAANRDWGNEKIARDLLQNFYDGNGHTLEGVKISAVKKADGTYTIRIDGQGIYNYVYLNRMGGSSKLGDPKDAGGFGEGSRIIAASLLLKGSEDIYAS